MSHGTTPSGVDVDESFGENEHLYSATLEDDGCLEIVTNDLEALAETVVGAMRGRWADADLTIRERVEGDSEWRGMAREIVPERIRRAFDECAVFQGGRPGGFE